MFNCRVLLNYRNYDGKLLVKYRIHNSQNLHPMHVTDCRKRKYHIRSHEGAVHARPVVHLSFIFEGGSWAT